MRKKQEEERRQKVRMQFAGKVIIPALDGGLVKRGTRRPNKSKAKKDKSKMPSDNTTESSSTSLSTSQASFDQTTTNTSSDSIAQPKTPSNDKPTTDVKDVVPKQDREESESESGESLSFP
jgi:hypothetical protein